MRKNSSGSKSIGKMIGKTATLVALGALASAAARRDSTLRLRSAKESVGRHADEVLVLDEEFEGELNHNLWKHEITMSGGGNWEFQVYGNNRTNSYVEDGKLVLQPTLTEDFLGKDRVSGVIPTTYDIWGLTPADQCTSNMFYGCSRGSNLASRIAINPVMSARVRTAGTFSFRYGRFEAKAKLPRGDWLWPAIWLLPESNAYGSWPASGEIDIMESRGNDPSYAANNSDIGGVDYVSSAVHWGPHYTMDCWEKTYGIKQADEGTFNDDFHIFGLYWDEYVMYTYVDNEDNKVLSIDFGDGTDVEGFWEKGNFAKLYPGMDNPWKGKGVSAPYDQRFYIVMNVAVGGVSGFFPDKVGGKMWNNKDSDAGMKFFEATSDWYSTWDGKEAAMQVESVKVWQTNPDYFLDAHAASSIAGTNSNGSPISTSTPVELGGNRQTPSSEKPSGSSSVSAVLLYLFSAAIGGVIGGVSVGWIMLRQIPTRWKYNSINTPNASSHPVLS